MRDGGGVLPFWCCCCFTDHRYIALSLCNCITKHTVAGHQIHKTNKVKRNDVSVMVLQFLKKRISQVNPTIPFVKDGVL